MCDFARLFYRKAPPHILRERDRDTLSKLTLGAFRFLGRAGVEEPSVQVINPEDEGWSAPVTVLRAEVGDRPFIVDTIREYLSAENLPVQHYIYPVLRVERGEGGKILAVQPPNGGGQESLVHCEIQRVHEEEARARIQGEVARRLSDVVAVTDDFPAMMEQVDRTIAVAERYREGFPGRAGEFGEVAEFLRWLKDENFVFLGYRGYDVVKDQKGEVCLSVEPGSGLGILRDEASSAYAGPVSVDRVPDSLRRRILAGPTLIVSKTNAESTVHRRARMDYIGVKKLDDEGKVAGERRLLGLFTSKAYQEDAEDIPILRHKLHRVLDDSGAPPASHDYKEIITIFNSFPKEELFQATPAEIWQQVREVLPLLFTDDIRAWTRADPMGRGVSVTVILPRGRFSGEVRRRIQEALVRRFRGQLLNYHLAMSAGDQARLHFFLAASPEQVEGVDAAEIERDVYRILRSWDDRLAEQLAENRDEEEAQTLARTYGPAFSAEYRAAFLPEVAAADVLEMERMRREETSVALTLREPRGRGRAEAFAGTTVLKLYLRDEGLILSDFMPILENTGLQVVEVTPFAVSGPGLPAFHIYSFAVQDPGGEPVPLEGSDRLTHAILAARRGDTPNDPLAALVLRAGLSWRQVDVLRTYANYTFQTGAVPSRVSLIRALLGYPSAARLLVDTFQNRFDPETESGKRKREGERLRRELRTVLDRVESLTDDRALRRMAEVIEATTRTNYFRHGGDRPTVRSGGAPYTSIKVHSPSLEELRETRLLYEVFVFSANMEGIHLRAAPVSRGGIRWSDRPDDFRTEVLGLVQTQVVKNAVIVPGGSKGGFVIKNASPDRKRAMEQAAAQYQTLIRGLLDLTDNVVDGEVVPPPGVVRHDGDDPYLVVAADKGTAHLSDTANQVAAEYDFWLGDAFASGGSQGYDHKQMGITARGAWECVKRHFRELGKDIQNEPFTVAGIGDMSGDVFGNGMLLSRQIKLVAAFDHRHVFLDPDPDPEASYLERERLFRLPGSSWDDYDRGALSEGGMIVPRGSKEVSVAPEAREALGLEGSPEKLDGEQLVRAVLKAPVELLWNGGVGTYVKHPEELHAQVGDTANDPVRVGADELRAKVVGEGGNLGFTQRARVLYALGGGRLNTDALDNSAGVGMSDHEVNLKILLDDAVKGGRLSTDERNRLLDEMSGEVSKLVLAHSVGQSLAVSLDEVRSRERLWDFAALISSLERKGLVDRVSEELPTSETLRERAEEGIGFSRPALAVLLSRVKLHAKAALLDSPLPDDPVSWRYLQEYLPAPARTAAGEAGVRDHRLRREIVATGVVNDLVDLMGCSFLFRTCRDSGHDSAGVARAWLIASELAGAPGLRADLASLEETVPSETVYRWLFGLARVLEGTTHWALANVAPDVPTAAVIVEHRDGLSRLQPEFPRLVSGEDRDLFLQRLDELREIGVEGALAERLITLRFLPQLLEILRIARESGTDGVAAARCYYLVSERFSLGLLVRGANQAAGEDHWEKRHAAELADEAGRARRQLTRQVLACVERGGEPEACLHQLEESRARELATYRQLLSELEGGEACPLAAFAVTVRSLLSVAGL